ncbi:hypothetical protein SUGI_0888050 [Cryptomeria japonica]|nr:hypothetical protein SUGI_0888050 [Cryptomeria japonica]
MAGLPVKHHHACKYVKSHCNSACRTERREKQSREMTENGQIQKDPRLYDIIIKSRQMPPKSCRQLRQKAGRPFPWEFGKERPGNLWYVVFRVSDESIFLNLRQLRPGNLWRVCTCRLKGFRREYISEFASIEAGKSQ